MLNVEMSESPIPDPIAEWIEAFDEQDAKRQLMEIDVQMKVLNDRRVWLTDAMALKERWRLAHGSSGRRRVAAKPTMQLVPDAHVPLDGPPPSGKQAAVLRILGSEDREWTTQEIRDTMIERRWMTAEDKDYASLMSTLSRMSGENAANTAQIYRPSRGRYRLSAPLGDDLP